ncbi:MAG: hypothetical protein M5U09_28280 [Gammaproteobacteria bacterium]|nr:hypothetical protein [Gammaproteobacteria bacterium]
MAEKTQTLGQAIDQAIAALEPLAPAARKTALDAVCAHLDIPVLQVTAGGQQPAGKAPQEGDQQTGADSGAAPPAPPPTQPRKDIRSLKAEKKPASARQMACLVAYYLQEHAPEGEKKETVSSADLEKYFKQAGFKLPQRIVQVLADAKGSGYFDSAGRGEYKLNAVGYNLVAHNLPKSGEAG